MPWVKSEERFPPNGAEMNCKLQHWHTKGITEHRLRKVDESDCTWRVVPGDDEVSHDWNVIEWFEEGADAGAELQV